MLSPEERVCLHHANCKSVLSGMSANSVDLIIADPPYGINYQSRRQTVDRKQSVEGRGSVVVREHYFNQIEDDKDLSTDWLKDAYRVLKDNSAIYVFAHWTKWKDLHTAVENCGFHVRNMIVLNKSNHGMGNLTETFAPRHELILYATKGKHKLRFPDGREDDVWNVPVKFSGSKRFHPNEKPLSWVMPIILNSSDIGQTILDPFMGSGTFGVAAINAGRYFIGIEIDPEYFAVADKRIRESVDKISSELF